MTSGLRSSPKPVSLRMDQFFALIASAELHPSLQRNKWRDRYAFNAAEELAGTLGVVGLGHLLRYARSAQPGPRDHYWLMAPEPTSMLSAALDK